MKLRCPKCRATTTTSGPVTTAFCVQCGVKLSVPSAAGFGSAAPPPPPPPPPAAGGWRPPPPTAPPNGTPAAPSGRSNRTAIVAGAAVVVVLLIVLAAVVGSNESDGGGGQPRVADVLVAMTQQGHECILDSNSDGTSRSNSRANQLERFASEGDRGGDALAELMTQMSADVSAAPESASIDLYQCVAVATRTPSALFYSYATPGEEQFDHVLGVYVSPDNAAAEALRGVDAKVTVISPEAWSDLTDGG